MSLSGFSILKAHEAQALLCRKIVKEDRLSEKIRLVAGVDAAYFDERAVGAVAVLDYETMRVVETQTATVPVRFPYVPTLLSFREIPPAVACIKKLRLQPDVFLVDGQGVAHPYGCGFASHLGLAIGKPTVGVAKSRLIGEPAGIDGKKFLVNEGIVVGSVLTTKEHAKPVYVSVGHLISLNTAVEIVEHCTRGNRIPEPLRAAHRMASEKRREMEVLEKPYVSPADIPKARWDAYERRIRSPNAKRPER
jgi:deoxyribonuclease V